MGKTMLERHLRAWGLAGGDCSSMEYSGVHYPELLCQVGVVCCRLQLRSSTL